MPAETKKREETTEKMGEVLASKEEGELSAVL